MTDAECVIFLQWALPRLGMRWRGFRKVRGQVCKRIRRRIGELGLEGPAAYRERLGREPGEWSVLDGLCRITISRFRRDRYVFEVLGDRVFPALAEEARARAGASPEAPPVLRAWSAGCGSGEEPYTLSLVWRLGAAKRFPDVRLEIVATDADPVVLERAGRARYPAGTLRELPEPWIREAFVAEEGASAFRLRSPFRRGIEFREEDLRERMPEGPFSLVLCRNLAFTYFAGPVQRGVLEGILELLPPGGFLVLGNHESLPPGPWPLRPMAETDRILRRDRAPGSGT